MLLILSLALGLVGPRLGALLPAGEEGLARRVEGLLREGRRRAALRREFVLLVLDPETRRLYLADAALKPLDQGVAIPEEAEVRAQGLLALGDRRAVLFTPQGFSTGGEIELDLPEGRVAWRVARFQSYAVRLAE